MSTHAKTNYAWDTCVLVAWLCDEASAPLQDIELVIDEIDKGKANLILSVTTFTEILESKYSQEQLDKLTKFIQRSNILNVETTYRVAKKASEIRDAAQKQGRKIETPDAQILATAILYKADVLHTFDEKLLHLNGSPTVEGLKITKPKPISGDKLLPFENPGHEETEENR